MNNITNNLAISDILEYIKQNVVVSYDDLKKRFNISDVELIQIKKRINKSKKVLFLKNKIVWAYCSPELERSLLKRRF